MNSNAPPLAAPGTSVSGESVPLCRPSVSGLNDCLGKVIPVLDDGFVRVVDYMGSDCSVVQAARVSYGAGTKHVSEDRALIRYLLRHGHTTPFEMCEIKLHVRVPMDCWRQWIRHRTASVNEYSTRYSIAIDSAQATTPAQWRSQSEQNRQGSDSYLSEDIGNFLSQREGELQKLAREVYAERLGHNVAREQARKDLPLATYTEAYWKVDLHNLFNFLRLRMDPHAQTEIRQYATVIGNQIVAIWCPFAWEAFCDYQLNATRLSKLETQILALLTLGKTDEALGILSAAGLMERGENGLRRNREREELASKLQELGHTIPWSNE